MIYVAILVVAIGVLIWDKISQQSEQTLHPEAYGNTFNSGTLSQNAGKLVTPGENIANESLSSSSSNIERLTLVLNQIEPVEVKAQQVIPHQRDIFAATDDFLKMVQISSSDEIIDNQAETQITLQLSSIIIGQRNRYALINNQIVCQGQYIGPYCVQNINENSVVLTGNNQRLLLMSINPVTENAKPVEQLPSDKYKDTNLPEQEISHNNSDPKIPGPERK